MLFKLLCFGLASTILQQPVGSIVGKISLERPGFGLQSYDLRSNKVYVTATGPRGTANDESGVWVQPDGTFRLDHLRKGEYQLKVHATGYSTEYENGVFVDDGTITALSKTIPLALMHPSVDIASNRRVFTSKEAPYFWANCSGAKVVTVRLYKTDIIKLMHNLTSAQSQDQPISFGSNLDVYKGPQAKEPKLFSGQEPVQILRRTLASNSDDWSNLQFKLDKPLPCGDYVGLAEVKSAAGEKDWNIFWFSVTDIGLIVKKDAEQFVIRAMDLNTLKPAPNVSIQFCNKDNRSFYPPRLNALCTGADGFLTFKLKSVIKSVAHEEAFLIGTCGQSHAYGGISIPDANAQSKTYKTYFYTERPIYRLGQTVYFKTITRLLGPDGFQSLPSGTKVSGTIEDPAGNKVWAGSFKINSHGCFTGIFNIPEDGKTGAYHLTFTYPDRQHQEYGDFEVAEYRKPEYEVSVTPLETRVISGGKIKARIKAAYYFGAPVANAKVKYSVYAANDYQGRYRLMQRPDYYGFFDDWSDDENGSYSYGGDYITEGTAQTDTTGEALVEIDTAKLNPASASPYENDYPEKKYKIEAEVTDLSRMSVVSSGSCTVTAGSFALFVEPQEYVATAGSPVTVAVSAISYEGKPIADQPVVVNMSRWIWDQSKNQYTGKEPLGEKKLVTDAQGKGTVVFETKSALPTDSYTIAATAQDGQGNTTYDQSSIWIASDRYPYIRAGAAAQKQPLVVRTDKPAYKPGEVAKVMVSGPVSGDEGMEAIVAIEGQKIYKYWTVPMTATAKLIEIPIQSLYEPNFYVTVNLVGKGNQFYNQSKIIRVSPQEHFLKLSIDTDKEKYKPGETVKYTIKALDQSGRPAANTELSLGLVDESIYAIRSEAAPDIQKFFYAKQENNVTTSSTFGEEYSGGPDKIEPRVRKDFRDTAVWLPDLVTNKNGLAVASVQLPDNLTTWRATVRGITMGTDVGSVINKIISTQDLIVRLALPRFFSLGDKTFISAIVHNYTKNIQPIKLTLNTSPQFQVQDKLQQSLTVVPDQAQRFSWPVQLASSGQASITVKAIGKTAGDAMETKINVLALGIPAFSAHNGLLLDDPSSVSIPYGVGANACSGTVQYHLGVAGSSIGPVLGSFDQLIDYPYGCTEQTMSRLMPSVVALTLHNKLGLPISNEMSVKFSKVYKRAMNKLADYQHGDGGWGWWQEDPSNPYLTSLVLEGFQQLQQVGYHIDKKRIERALAWLSKASMDLHSQLASPQHVANFYQDGESAADLAKMAYTLTVYHKKAPPAVLNWLFVHDQSLTPEALCYLCLTLKNNKDERSQKAYQRLLSLANRHDQFVDWDHTRHLLDSLGISPDYSDYDYRFTGIETTALALRTVLVLDPSNSDLIEAVKSWLLVQRNDKGWDNTKTTAQVFLALLEEQLAFNRLSSSSTTLVIDLADKLLNSLAFDQTNRYAPEKEIAVRSSPLPQIITLKKTGTGRVYYNSLTTYIQRLQPGENVAAKSLPKGLMLERSFCRLVPNATTSDGKIHFRSERISDNVFHAGETVLMKIKVDSPIALPYTILETYLPSGAEVVQDQTKEDLVNNDRQSDLVGDWARSWWTHQDILDDRIVFFVTRMPAGKSEFSTLVRLEMPGTFQINPLRLEGMYAKNVRGYSTLDSIRVTE